MIDTATETVLMIMTKTATITEADITQVGTVFIVIIQDARIATIMTREQDALLEINNLRKRTMAIITFIKVIDGGDVYSLICNWGTIE